jgi:hypothetical protein
VGNSDSVTEPRRPSLAIESLAGGLLLFVVLGLWLLQKYPWSDNSDSGFSLWTTAASYLVLASLMAVIGTVSIHLGLRRQYAFEAAVLASIITAFAWGVGAFAFGPLGFDIPGTRVRGIFFADWNFVTFFLYLALPVAALTGLIGALAHRRRRTME